MQPGDAHTELGSKTEPTDMECPIVNCFPTDIFFLFLQNAVVAIAKAHWQCGSGKGVSEPFPTSSFPDFPYFGDFQMEPYQTRAVVLEVTHTVPLYSLLAIQSVTRMTRCGGYNTLMGH